MDVHSEPVSIVHISDTHIGPSADYRRHGHSSLPGAERVVQIINSLPIRPDAVVHTGDVVAHPSPDAYAEAARVFAGLEVPVYYVVGNHDRSEDIARSLPMGPREELDPERSLLTYAVNVRGERLLMLDARAPDEMDPHGLLSERQLEIVRSEATPDGPPLTVFVHFPLWPLNARWFDENMLIVNGPELHDALLPARGRLRGVFHGHLHMQLQTYRDAVLYASVPSTFANFTGWPEDEAPRIADSEPGYSVLYLMEGQTVVHHHTFARPGVE
ncbi:MAG: metallophosphoesterase family protein [Spirochaetota bacterium]